MDSHDNRKVLVVFLGSPGDVAKERRVARKAVDRLNGILRKIGWHIDLRGWEETLPGQGRPQELINADVRACKLFVGLLWARWGSQSGKYSSGFEEEYRLALELRKQAGSPEVWMFFKNVSPAQLKDPGDQLKKVLEFREEMIASKEVLFKDIKTVTEWKERFPDLLLEHIFKLHDQSRPHPAEALRPPVVAGGLAALSLDPAVAHPEVSSQLSETLREAAAVVLSPNKLGAFQAARLRLFATTALSSHTSAELGVREVNLLYLHRAELKATPEEQNLLYKTVAGENWDVCPGWYWFADHDADRTKRYLFWLAASPEDDRVRIRSVELLAGCGIQPEIDGFSREDLISRFLRDASPEARRVKVDYLGTVGAMVDLPALARLTRDEDGQVRSKVEEAHALILTRNGPNRVLTEVVDQRQVLYKSVRKEMAKRARELDASVLRAAIAHPDPAVRLFVAQLLEKRGDLTPDLARHFSDDPSDKVKTIGYRELVRSGAALSIDGIEFRVQDAVKDCLVEASASQSFEALMGQIEFYSIGGLVAYSALARYHFGRFAGRLRSDLTDGFESMRSAWIRKWEPLLPPGHELLHSYKKDGDIDRFVRGRFLAVALGELARQGEQQDATFGRRYLTSGETDVRLAAVALLERFGDESDCNRLLEAAAGEWPTQEAAAKAAVKLAKGSTTMIMTLLESGVLPIVRVAIGSLKPTDFPVVKSKLMSLLRHTLDEVRVAAVAGLHKLADRATLEAILDDYPSGGFYYYNVVCWLDRVLYAPEPLREMYVRSLDECIFPSDRSDDESARSFT